MVVEGDVDPGWLAERVTAFVAARSEGGRRAQAVAAGLMDAFAGPKRVEAGRINDPDRHLPGDVGVRPLENGDGWSKIVEVRDKPVSSSDLHAFAGKCVEAGTREALVLSVSRKPTPDSTDAARWAADRGLTLTVYGGWDGFIREVLLWSEQPSPAAAAAALLHIQQRLAEVEASPEAMKEWLAICGEVDRPSTP